MLRTTLSVLLFTLVACGKAPNPPAVGKEQADDWLTYEDDMFRAKYPPNSEVFGAKDSKQDPSKPSFGIIPPPAAGNSFIGAFTLQPDTASKGMLLRDGVEAAIKKTKGERGIVLSPPKEISVANGRCLGTIVITPTTNCEKGTGSCFSPIFPMLCDGQNGARYTASTVLSSSASRDRLSPQAQQEAATYERILRSLEFKKS